MARSLTRAPIAGRTLILEAARDTAQDAMEQHRRHCPPCSAAGRGGQSMCGTGWKLAKALQAARVAAAEYGNSQDAGSTQGQLW